jgi:hypothetical protein
MKRNLRNRLSNSTVLVLTIQNKGVEGDLRVQAMLPARSACS